MPTPGNSVNITATGLVKFDGTATFTGITATNHAVLVGGASNGITNIGPGSTGQVFQSAGASADPAYSTATYPATATGTGKHLYADGTNWVASTPTFANTAGTAGKVLISDGTNFITSTPTFPNASATSRKIIVSDATNWVASTETYAVPGTSGNVLTSDGTNWTSAAPAGAGSVTTIFGQLTNAQIKALHGTPVQIIAAPGANKMIIIVKYTSSYVYGGTSAFTAAAAQTISLYYGTTTAINTITANARLVGTANRIDSTFGTTYTTSANSNFSNVAVNLYNPVATEISGNAANDNLVNYAVEYYIASV